MPKLAIHAHYDGERIVLDEPFEFPADASLLVTVLPVPSKANLDSEEAWLRAAATSDAFDFLADPVEDIYSPTDGEPLQDAA